MQPETLIAHYRIIHLLGKGGMGEVYLAEDTKLQRQVALKFLPEVVRQDADRLERFRREALAAASLMHPNIATIHAFEEITAQDDQTESFQFIVMEYVTGKVLTDHISDDGMDLDTFFNTFIPLADALSHAHEKGRIHRDLKPGNIILDDNSIPKILDFGLARIIDSHSTQAKKDMDSDVPTKTISEVDNEFDDQQMHVSAKSRFMGTPAYMSPEQAERKPVDARTDLFSLGLVMYESLTGQRLFPKTTSQSLTQRATEPVQIVSAKTPHQLSWIVRKCLQQDPAHRVQTARELHSDLREIQNDVSAGIVLVDASTVQPIDQEPDQKPFWQKPFPIAIAFLLVGILITTFSMPYFLPVPPQPVRKFELTIKSGTGLPLHGSTISPDGTRIAFIQGGSLWIRDLDQLEPRQIPDVEFAVGLFWSPENDMIGYIRRQMGQQAIHKVSPKGGPSTLVSIISDSLGSFQSAIWRKEGSIILNLGGSLYSLPSQGGTPRLVKAPDKAGGEESFGHVTLLPDGESYIYIVKKIGGTQEFMTHSGDRTTSFFSSREEISYPCYVPSGHILYQRGRLDRTEGIWAVPFDLASFTVTDEPTLIDPHGEMPKVSTDGTLVFHSGENLDIRQLVWVDRNGRLIDRIGDPQEGLADPALSPDEKWIAASGSLQSNVNIWLHDVNRKTRTRLSFDPTFDWQSAWSPDGNHISFYTRRQSGERDIFLTTPVGGVSQILVGGPHAAMHPNWSKNGQYMLYSAQGDMWYMDMQNDHQIHRLSTTDYAEFLPVFSPDGRYVAYVSAVSGRNEVYITKFPSGEGRWQVSVNGGTAVRWSQKSNEIFYVANQSTNITLMAARVDTRSTLQISTPEPLFTGDQVKSALNGAGIVPHYDVTADGQRFVLAQNVGEGSSTITIIENWRRTLQDSE